MCSNFFGLNHEKSLRARCRVGASLAPFPTRKHADWEGSGPPNGTVHPDYLRTNLLGLTRSACCFAPCFRLCMLVSLVAPLIARPTYRPGTLLRIIKHLYLPRSKRTVLRPAAGPLSSMVPNCPKQA